VYVVWLCEGVWVCVCLCVVERERESVCVCVYLCGVSLFVGVCVRLFDVFV